MKCCVILDKTLSFCLLKEMNLKLGDRCDCTIPDSFIFSSPVFSSGTTKESFCSHPQGEPNKVTKTKNNNGQVRSMIQNKW